MVRPPSRPGRSRRDALLAAVAAGCAPHLPVRAATPAAERGDTGSASSGTKRGEFRTSDGVRLSRLVVAEDRPGPTLVFVPGWCMPADIFRPQLEALRHRHRAVAFDPRGQGESEVARGGYTLERRTADIAELLAPLDDVVLVAWSLGVLEALQYIATHGERRLSAVVLIDNSVGEPPAPRPGDFIARLRADRGRALDGFVRSMFRSPQPEPYLARLVAQAQRMPLEASIALLSYPPPREHWRDIARGIACPLAYAVTPRLAAQARSLREHRPATRIEAFDDAGHALFVDEPDRFSRLVLEMTETRARR